MTRANLRTYTAEFRAEAVKLVLGQGLSLEEAGQRLAIQFQAGVPSGTIQYQNRMTACWHCCTDCLQLMCHGFGVGMGKHNPGRAVLRRAERPKYIGRFRLLLTHHARSRSLACPQSRLHSPLADPHFILKPDIDLVSGDVGRHDRLHLERERFF